MTFTESNTVQAYLRNLFCGTSANDSPPNLQVDKRQRIHQAQANDSVRSTTTS